MALPFTLVDAYQALIDEGALSVDSAQHEAVLLLNDIGQSLVALEAGKGGIAGFFKKRHKAPKGAYIWGKVGRGKTLLMDLFFETVPIKTKRRVHFHEFMDEVHAAIAEYRAAHKDQPGRHDPIPYVVKPIMRDVRLLCFDEFHVQDITNAMLLQRLFEKLFSAGIVVVATSNVPPDRLYEDGLNRQLFLPFIELLGAHTHVLELVAEKDYRRDKLAGQEIYYFGKGAAASASMDKMWRRLASGQKGEAANITSLGRQIEVPQQAMGVARFSFAQLCEQPLGARDYLKLANEFHTFIIDDVPQFDRQRTDASKRFILLIDTLYDRGVKLAASFAVQLDKLGADKKTAFEFQRCVSRLIEMQSETYLAAPLKQTKPS